jgi:outer membrane protein
MKIKNLIACSTALLGFTGSAQADFIGIYLGGGVYSSEFSGDIRDANLSSNFDIDLQDNLGLDREANLYLYAAFEHPVPLLPNVRISRTQLKQTGKETLSDEIAFAGETFVNGTAINSTVDLSHTDGTLYYEILDNWVNLDLGITARKFDSEIVLNGAFQGLEEKAERSLDFVLPLGYLKIRGDLPFTGLSVSASVNAMSYDGSRFHDLSAWASYEFSFGLGLEAGLRNIALEIDDQDNVSGELDFTGIFAGLSFHL